MDQKPFEGSEQGRDVTSLVTVTSIPCWGKHGAWSKGWGLGACSRKLQPRTRRLFPEGKQVKMRKPSQRT